ncbi:PI-3-kinase-related kinase SMG-1 [Clonorchis sinensis]|uniref:PI-3-kinase-related kinase SMG-1 n=1 Tax=Clonorchis sinensis TaxID=79923 RepID=H2KRX9_CLOSI|nr:PI-3-kinase-related kinase SMG-1 [Clonorchis sinensis]
MFVECLASLFSVLHHQPTGAFHFTAGYEADARRETAFLLGVRDVCHCLVGLKLNLIRLLLPAATDALIDVTGDLAEDFSKFVARHLTESNTTSLPDLVETYLGNYNLSENPSASRLHQVLIAVHLALVNTAAQLDDIAQRIRTCSVTALAWYYVDILAQATSTMLSRCSEWREGATCLWGWESSGTCNSQAGSNPCSWLDEIYASGLMAFISILDDCRAHWQAIHWQQEKHLRRIDAMQAQLRRFEEETANLNKVLDEQRAGLEERDRLIRQLRSNQNQTSSVELEKLRAEHARCQEQFDKQTKRINTLSQQIESQSDEILAIKLEALTASLCEKEANIALMELTAPKNAASNQALDKMRTERDQLQIQQRQLANTRAMLEEEKKSRK